VSIRKESDWSALSDFIDHINLKRDWNRQRRFLLLCYVGQGIQEYDSPKTVKPRLREQRYNSTWVCFTVSTSGFTVGSISFIVDKGYYYCPEIRLIILLQAFVVLYFLAAYSIVRKFHTQSWITFVRTPEKYQRLYDRSKKKFLARRQNCIIRDAKSGKINIYLKVNLKKNVSLLFFSMFSFCKRNWKASREEWNCVGLSRLLFCLNILFSFRLIFSRWEINLQKNANITKRLCRRLRGTEDEDNVRKLARLAEIIWVLRERLCSFFHLLFLTLANSSISSLDGKAAHIFLIPTFRAPTRENGNPASTLLAAEGFICRGCHCNRPQK